MCAMDASVSQVTIKGEVTVSPGFTSQYLTGVTSKVESERRDL